MMLSSYDVLQLSAEKQQTVENSCSMYYWLSVSETYIAYNGEKHSFEFF